MDVLVLGGSVFLGRAVVDEALAAGHHVTVFNRGLSGSQPDAVEQLRGDRTVPADLAQLAGRRFDLVIDTCGYVPADVASSAGVLRDAAAHYVFVSSISAYPRWPADPGYGARGVFDGQPDATRDSVPSDVEDWQAYGWLKAGCELAVERAFGAGRCTMLRAGCIVGPHDSAVGRLPWWLARFARGSETLVPGSPDAPIALIDARDLAAFALVGAPGAFECGGPHGRDTWQTFVDALGSATGGLARPTWVDGTWLAAQDVEEWTELPLWIGEADGAGVWNHDNSPAEAAGLRWRPLEQTVTDTWAWQSGLDGWVPTERAPGLAAPREQDLLAAWHTR